MIIKDVKNLKEFCKLILKYESITLKQLKSNEFISCNDSYTNSKSTIGLITGFGTYSSCTLCLKVKQRCAECYYGSDDNCTINKNGYTYTQIGKAKTAIQLFNAIKARAKHMRKLLKRHPKTAEKMFKKIIKEKK